MDCRRALTWNPSRPFLPSCGPRVLGYLLDFGVHFDFDPTDFCTQVNVAVNRVLVRRAIGLLDPVPGDRIADFFCGIGNFTLPIARRGADVIGVEGSPSLSPRGRCERRARNALADLCAPRSGTCSEATAAEHRRRPRAAGQGPDRSAAGGRDRPGHVAAGADLAVVLGLSCNAATLARDAAALTGVQGFVLRAAGIANMFPHTACNVSESIALFDCWVG